MTAQNDSMKKAHVIAPHVAALQAGAGEVGALLVQELSQITLASGLDGITPVMGQLRETTRTRYQDWFPSIPPIQAPGLVMSGQAPARPDLVFIVAGYEMTPDPGDTKIFQLASGSDFSPMLHDYGFAVAGVAQYALYLLNRLYEPDRTVQELAALAVYVITETASQDGKVGGPVNLVSITPAGSTAFTSVQVQAILDRNDERSQALRDSFYDRN